MQGQPSSQQKTLLLDMKVRWGSTLAMLRCGHDLKSVSCETPGICVLLIHILKYVNDFVYELGHEESNHAKRAKIDALKLTEDEWTEVSSFIDLLKVLSPPFMSHRWAYHKI